MAWTKSAWEGKNYYRYHFEDELGTGDTIAISINGVQVVDSIQAVAEAGAVKFIVEGSGQEK